MTSVLPTGRRLRLSRRTVVGLVGALLVSTAGGAAYAAWAVTATGSSSATSGGLATGLVSPATPTAILYPGESTAVYFTVTNPNSFPVTYTNADFGTVTVDNPTACPPANLTVTDQVVSVSVPAGGTSAVQSPAGAISMSDSAPVGCQDRTFTVATTLTGASD